VNILQFTVMVVTLVMTAGALIYARRATRQNSELLGMAQRSSQLNDEAVGAIWHYLLVSESDISTAKGSWSALKRLTM
jgi:hypothetical protein